MGKIATEQEAHDIGGSGTPVSNKCCTSQRARELGCKVSGMYTINQLVQVEDLSVQAITVAFSGFLPSGRSIKISGGLEYVYTLPANVRVRPGDELQVVWGFGTTTGTVRVTSTNCKLFTSSTEFTVESDYSITGTYRGSKLFRVYDIQEGAKVNII